MSRRGAALTVLACVLAAGCGGSASPRPEDPPVALGEPVVFAWGTTDGAELSSATTRGRATALLFVTTYDAASQVAARRLDEAIRRFVPRANAGAIILEPPKNAVLADVFRSTLELAYPVAIADQGTLRGAGPFGRIDRVPTLVILDRSGRVSSARAGAATPREIEAALRTASEQGRVFDNGGNRP